MCSSIIAQRSAVYLNEDGIAERLKRFPFMSSNYNEAWLQGLLASTPSLLPAADFGVEYSPLICIGREVPVGSKETQGYIDNLYISPSGHIVIVETKLFRNQEARRTVVAQIIDYAKELQKWDSEKLNSVASDYFYILDGQASTIFDVMLRKGYLTSADEARFNDNINTNLQNASFLLLIVGDGIRSGVKQLSDFLNDNTAMNFKLGLVELEIYQHGNGAVVIPNTITKTVLIERGVPFSQYMQASDDEFKKSSPYVQRPILSRRDFISTFADNGGWDADEITEFICDLESIHGITIKITPTELTVRFSPEDGYSYALLTFSIASEQANMWVMPGRIQAALEKHGIFSFEANHFLEFFKSFVDIKRCKTPPYENLAGFYYADLTKVFNSTKSFITEVEKFTTSIE